MRSTLFIRRAFPALLLALAIPAAAQTPTTIRTAVRPALRTTVAAPPGLSTEQQQWLARHCILGAPRMHLAWAGTPTRMVVRQGYALLHSSVDRIPLWVCEGLERAQLEGSAERDDAFAPDPLLKPGTRAELADYKGTGFDRGHLAPAADQSANPVLKAETFFLSNMAPQAPRLNQQAWRELEDLVRRWLIARGNGYVITGGFFHDPNEDEPKTADGLITYQVIGGNAVAVPTHFYKIVAARKPDGAWDVIGFVMENREYPRPFRFQEHVRPIAWIEEQTGIDFFPEMPARDAFKLEFATPTLWQ
jgi:endonuclease G, mitochondrial